MAEQIDLTTPDQSTAGTPNYRISSLSLDWDAARIDIGLNSASGIRRAFSYSGAAATTLLKALNTANLSTTSLHKRILQRLKTDGHLAGSISGVPD